jgi:hypothetical protein
MLSPDCTAPSAPLTNVCDYSRQMFQHNVWLVFLERALDRRQGHHPFGDCHDRSEAALPVRRCRPLASFFATAARATAETTRRPRDFLRPSRSRSLETSNSASATKRETAFRAITAGTTRTAATPPSACYPRPPWKLNPVLPTLPPEPSGHLSVFVAPGHSQTTTCTMYNRGSSQLASGLDFRAFQIGTSSRAHARLEVSAVRATPLNGIWTREVPRYTQIGHAVPVKLAEAVANHLRSIIG